MTKSYISFNMKKVDIANRMVLDFVASNLSEDEIDEVLRLARNKFENLGYRVYFTGAKYNYQGENRIVESNEYLVAIKGL